MHHVIILPTLMDSDAGLIRVLTAFWKKRGLIPVVLGFGWKEMNNGADFENGVAKIVAEVDRLAKLGKVSLVGCSAGGSAVVNVFSHRKDVINKVVDVCGALRHDGDKLNKMDTMAYLQSLNSCEKIIRSLSEEENKKFLVIRPRFGDEFVKKEEVFIANTVNITNPTGEHLLTIATSLTIFSKKIFDFLLAYEK